MLPKSLQRLCFACVCALLFFQALSSFQETGLVDENFFFVIHPVVFTCNCTDLASKYKPIQVNNWQENRLNLRIDKYHLLYTPQGPSEEEEQRNDEPKAME